MQPLLYIPLKRTGIVDFGPAFSDHISQHYQEDPSSYQPQITQLNKLRTDGSGAGRDISGRDIWYRYYGQLELLDSRFPITESGVKVLFTWYDAFTGEETCQYSVAYEKACTIFNIASTLSAIASQQDRSSAAGQKLAYNYFQSAAGLFQFINDNFLHPPSLDLSKVLVGICLGQAQECFIEKVISEAKSANLISKLCAHTAFLYSTAHTDMLTVSLVSQFDKAWVEFVRIKALYYDALAHFHRSLHHLAETHYGDALSYIIKSDDLTKECVKLSVPYAKKHSSFRIVSIGSSQPPSSQLAIPLNETIQQFAKRTAEHRKSQTRDNDVIYHEPTTSAPKEIEKTSVVKLQTFQDLFSTKEEIHRIIGQDIFIKLVPMSVHESASVYSEELNQLQKKVCGECELADEMFGGMHASLGVAKVLTAIKGSELTMPHDVIDICEGVRDDEGRDSKSANVKQDISKLKREFTAKAAECKALLDKDGVDDEEYKLKYAQQWMLDRSFQTTVEFRQDLKKFEDAFDQASKSDEGNSGDAIVENLKILKQPVRKLEELLNQMCSNTASSLIDVQDDNINSDSALVKKIEDANATLREVKAERLTLLQDFKKKITQSLVLNRGKENLVFQNEIAKFQPLQLSIAKNIKHQAELFQSLTQFIETLQKTSSKLKLLKTSTLKREEVYESWREAYGAYLDYRHNLETGLTFYNELLKMLNTTTTHAKRSIDTQSALRVELAKKIDNQSASFEQNSMRNQLANLGISSVKPQTTGGGQYNRPAPLPPAATPPQFVNVAQPQGQYGYQQAPINSQYQQVPSTQQYRQATSTQQYKQAPPTQQYQQPPSSQYQQAPPTQQYSQAPQGLQYNQSPQTQQYQQLADQYRNLQQQGQPQYSSTQNTYQNTPPMNQYPQPPGQYQPGPQAYAQQPNQYGSPMQLPNQSQPSSQNQSPSNPNNIQNSQNRNLMD